MEKRIADLIRIQKRIQNLIMKAVEKKNLIISHQDLMAPLTPHQVAALIDINNITPCCLSDVAELLNISLPSASVLVDALVEKGLLIRRIDPDDRRRVIITVEESSKESMDAVNETISAAINQLANRMGTELFDEWYEVLTKMERSVLDTAFSRNNLVGAGRPTSS